MKLLNRTLALTLSAAMVLGLLSGCGSDASANVLNVYNWGEYIDTDLLDRFEQETGIKVIYNTFDSNENLYSRIQTTSYDVIIPSDYAISRFIDEDMLQPLNFDNIPNLKLIDEKNLDALFPKSSPVYTKIRDDNPTRYVTGSKVENSILADGCLIEGTVENCVLFRGVRVKKGAVVRNCVLMQDTVVEPGAQLDCVVTDKNVRVTAEKKLSGTESFPVYVQKNHTV